MTDEKPKKEPEEKKDDEKEEKPKPGERMFSAPDEVTVRDGVIGI